MGARWNFGAHYWISASSSEREKINVAVVQIDALLGTDPQQRGESRPQDRRILLIPPLGVIYKVFEQESLVKVLRILRFRRH
jgi:hypothetical protein